MCVHCCFFGGCGLWARCNRLSGRLFSSRCWLAYSCHTHYLSNPPSLQHEESECLIIPDNHFCLSRQRSVRFLRGCGSALHVLPERGADWMATSPAVAPSSSERGDNCSPSSCSFSGHWMESPGARRALGPGSGADFWVMLPSGAGALSALMRATGKKKKIEGRSVGRPCHFFFLVVTSSRRPKQINSLRQSRTN